MKELKSTEKALTVVEQHKKDGANVFVRDEDLDTQSLFFPEVVVVRGGSEDFHKISGKYMPKSYQVDRIGEAAGVSFVAEQCGTRRESDMVYVGWAQGWKRQTDGTLRYSQKHEYEFDVDVRSRDDFIKDAKRDQPKYTTPVAKEEHVLEMRKFARQRAGTGARLKVIRELVGMPTSFREEAAKEAFVFSRVRVNSDRALADPATAALALQAAMGATARIYGPRQAEKTQPVASLTDDTVEHDDFDDEGTTGATVDEELADRIKALREELTQYLTENDTIKASAKAVDLLTAALNEPDTSLDELVTVKNRAVAYIEKKQGGTP